MTALAMRAVDMAMAARQSFSGKKRNATASSAAGAKKKRETPKRTVFGESPPFVTDVTKRDRRKYSPKPSAAPTAMATKTTPLFFDEVTLLLKLLYSCGKLNSRLKIEKKNTSKRPFIIIIANSGNEKL
ncbi:MAG: hypothetical protein GX189_03925 [Clostridiales bacterium]|nr:hypothetical protein [Clostridiales bacterium]